MTNRRTPTAAPTVITAEQAMADGMQPWTLRAIAKRHCGPVAAELRRVAQQLAAMNDNQPARRAV